MNHVFNIGALAAAALIACTPALAAQAAAPSAKQAVVSPQAGKALNVLADEYYDALARFDPVSASESGDNRFIDQIGMTISPTERTKQFARYKAFQKRLHAIKRNQLNARDQTSYDILDYELATALRFEPFPEHLLPLNQMDSMPVTLANYASGQGAQPLTTTQDYRAYASRLAQLGPWIDQAIANMREGIKRGIVHPRPVMVSALPQFKQLVAASPETSIYYTPVTNFPGGFSDADKRALTKLYGATIGGKLNPALNRLATFIDKEYLPATRTSTGWNALPNGAAWYQVRVASQTTTDLTPEAIHEIGLKEVARIQGEYGRTGPKMGYNGPAAGLPAWVAQQPKFKPFKTEQEVIDVYRKLDAQLRTKLPSMFNLMPKSPLDLRLEPELSRATASDHYTPPAVDGTRPGVFWSVVNDPTQYGSTGMVTLFLHEGQPGHHFHIALVQELGLPNFRKFGGNNAFTEGWALYAETLGKDMGLFDKPEDYFGHLNDEMLRAARLVVDTGIHTKGWTREQAITYFSDTLGYSEADSRAQIERYMIWPGQALGYKIGALKITELRRRAEAALGPKFDLRAFHDIVLGEGTLPLSLLEAKVDRWIVKSK
ncbi:MULTISPECIES: DUF885 family protein [unclassified Massilia]|uniref:DUF885 domain-containing protein n=1 Tax=unclassified Massilia TaxID=2609279 RepID=UPI00177ACD52|nr:MULTISPECIES: DUF885 domain-containing protein [unclassified Massilia]MBD8532703.1 DUF885 domain-containing protein [Massilia sp. CFBP 13647]MBD8676064.1 DUF885 domain-containing protein [Massilia sp. CFBP 13721]